MRKTGELNRGGDVTEIQVVHFREGACVCVCVKEREGEGWLVIVGIIEGRRMCVLYSIYITALFINI
jgi:hypothetical protein